MPIIGELREQVQKLCVEPEPSHTGDWYAITTETLAEAFHYIEFHFDSKTGELTAVRLSRNEDW